MEKIIRTDGHGEHVVIFAESNKDKIMVHMRHRMSYEDRQALIKAVPGVAYCFGTCGDYALDITIPKAYSHNEVIPTISKWLTSWLYKNHPQTVMHKICAACCPFRS